MGCPLNGIITPACSIREASDLLLDNHQRNEAANNPRRPPGRRELESAEKAGDRAPCRRKSLSTATDSPSGDTILLAAWDVAHPSQSPPISELANPSESPAGEEVVRHLCEQAPLMGKSRPQDVALGP